MYEYKSPFAMHIEGMLSFKESLGYSKSTHEPSLRNFDRFCMENYPEKALLSEEIVLSWLKKRPQENSGGLKKRANTIRQFGKYLTYMGHQAYILPANFVGGRSGFIPYIFSDEELASFFAATDVYPKGKFNLHRQYVVSFIFRLIYCCGLRPNEARLLETGDVDLTSGRLTIKDTKMNKDMMAAIGQLRSYYEKTCPRLVPEIATELIVLDKDAQPALESSAGYKQFLIGAPHYLLLMSAPHSYAAINAGYMMEDLVLKLTELDIDTCWMTFTDSDKIKKALSLTTPLEVAAIVAFGYGEKTAKKLRLNILSMSQIDVRAEQQYYAPKKGVHDLVHMGSWSNKSGLDEMMDFYDDMLWQSFYAASLSPSYLNRQPYGFLVQDHSIYLVQQEDAYTDNLDAALDLGIVMLHFSAVASQWAGQVRWELSPAAPDGLPEGLRSAAVYHM